MHAMRNIQMQSKMNKPKKFKKQEWIEKNPSKLVRPKRSRKQNRKGNKQLLLRLRMGFQQGEEDICLDILANRNLLLPNTWNHSQKSYDPRKKMKPL